MRKDMEEDDGGEEDEGEEGAEEEEEEEEEEDGGRAGARERGRGTGSCESRGVELPYLVLAFFVSNFFRRLTYPVRETMFGHRFTAAAGDPLTNVIT